MLLVVLLFTLLISIRAQIYDKGDIESAVEFRNRAEFGVLATAFKTIHDSYYKSRLLSKRSPTKKECETRIVKIGFVPYFTTIHPRGKCSYCCPVNNIDKYVTLYWTNKATGGKMTQLPSNYKAGSLRAANFNTNSPTVVYVHGWSQDALGYHSQLVSDAYLGREEEHNLIFVDWKDLAAFPWYVNSKENIKIVADSVANFLNFYIKSGEIDVSKLHMIGFSFGAHVVGMVGKNVKGVPRITGLDPAVALFQLNNTLERLVETDGDFVDIIHSDTNLLGFFISIGHADFYPNGEKFNQPGCNFTELSFDMIGLLGACNHFRAIEYYAESVKHPEAFPSTKCKFPHFKKVPSKCQSKATTFMGFSANKQNAKGDYYVKTSDRSPFGKTVSTYRSLDYERAWISRERAIVAEDYY